MADSYTPNLLLTDQEAGGNNNTWGDIADANFTRLDAVLGSTTSISTTGGNTTLTSTQELVAIIKIDGTLANNAAIIFSGRGGFWLVQNDATGDYTVTCKVSGQTGVQIPQGSAKIVYCDGTDISLGQTDAATAAEVTIASTTTTDVLGAASEFVAISGTATITSLGTGATKKRFCRATGAFKLTHNSTSLILPGEQSITAKAGDTFVVVSDASSNCRVFAYQRAAGTPVVSSIPIGTLQEYLLSTLPSDEWLWADSRTIGNASSNATARASSSPDTQALFEGLWAGYSNSILAIQDSAGTPTSRGASAAADFAANKRLPVPSARDRFTIGRANMGGTDAALIADNDTTVLGQSFGTEKKTVAQTNLPNVNFQVTSGQWTPTIAGWSTAHTYIGQGTSTGSLNVGGTVFPSNHLDLVTNPPTFTSNPAMNVPSGGSGTPLEIMPPALVVNKIIYAGRA